MGDGIEGLVLVVESRREGKGERDPMAPFHKARSCPTVLGKERTAWNMHSDFKPRLSCFLRIEKIGGGGEIKNEVCLTFFHFLIWGRPGYGNFRKQEVVAHSMQNTFVKSFHIIMKVGRDLRSQLVHHPAQNTTSPN